MPNLADHPDPPHARSFKRWVRPLLYVWTGPTTCVGLFCGILTMATGGKAQIKQGAVEFHGGFSRWLGKRCGFAAMTLGHAIVGVDAPCLDACRDHEQVHVRQAERWGPLFIPAYLIASVVAKMKGKHYYYDNVFEIDARDKSGF